MNHFPDREGLLTNRNNQRFLYEWRTVWECGERERKRGGGCLHEEEFDIISAWRRRDRWSYRSTVACPDDLSNSTECKEYEVIGWSYGGYGTWDWQRLFIKSPGTRSDYPSFEEHLNVVRPRRTSNWRANRSTVQGKLDEAVHTRQRNEIYLDIISVAVAKWSAHLCAVNGVEETRCCWCVRSDRSMYCYWC